MAACVLALALFLTGCGTVSLGDRAIVKAIFLDRRENVFQSAIVVFSCAPTTDAASAEGQARIYLGEGEDVASALADAESKQTKDPFYAQNGLLLLGSGCLKMDPTPVLAYFGEEETSRKDLTVFLTPIDVQKFSEFEDSVADTVREAEDLAASPDGAGAFGLQDADCENGFSGLLPVLDLDESGTAQGVSKGVLFDDGAPQSELEDAEFQLALLLLGKTGQLSFEIPEERLSVNVKGATVRRSLAADGLRLQLAMTGTIMTLSRGGRALYAEQAAEATDKVDRYLEKTFDALVSKTFGRRNDVFGFSWWLRMRSSALVDELDREQALYDDSRLSFSCRLRHG